MKRLITYVFLAAAIGCLDSCFTRKPVYMEYNLNDVPFRNMVLNFYKDSSFSLDNQKEGVGFASGGKWQLIDKHTYLVINPYCLGHPCDTSDQSIAQGGKVDYDLYRKLGTRYIFPLIARDTVRFSDNYGSAVLRGYQFSGYRRPK